MRLIWCLRSYLLLDLWSDSDETWRVYRVHRVLLHEAIFDFRTGSSGSVTESGPFLHNVIYVLWEKYFRGHRTETRFISLMNAERDMYTLSKFHSNWFSISGGSRWGNLCNLFLPFRDRKFLVSRVLTQILTIDLRKVQIHFHVSEWDKYHAFQHLPLRYILDEW